MQTNGILAPKRGTYHHNRSTQQCDQKGSISYGCSVQLEASGASLLSGSLQRQGTHGRNLQQFQPSLDDLVDFQSLGERERRAKRNPGWVSRLRVQSIGLRKKEVVRKTVLTISTRYRRRQTKGSSTSFAGVFWAWYART